MTLKERLLHWVLPLTCYACSEDLAEGEPGPLCPRCLARVRFIEAPYCERCGVPLADGGAHCFECRARGKSALRRLRAAAAYGPELASVVHAFKYQSRRTLGPALGAWLKRAFSRYPELAQAELAVPVPLHPRRERERGFNQAEELARALGLQSRRVLIRARATRPQVGLDRQARGENVKEAFEAAEDVKGRRFLLVDDLATTAATLEACAAVLRRGGAVSVDALVLARQPLE